jgi:hypothetical protein
MGLSIEEQAEIRRAVAKVDDAEAVAVLRGHPSDPTRFWAEDLVVNSPGNEVVALADLRERLRTKTGLQYSSFERHREATVVRRGCGVTMGYEIVVPKGNATNAGRKIRRRYTNVYAQDGGEWRLIARQATELTVE